jgi:hypothetical protein
LTVKDPEKYEFKPKQLLKQVPWRHLAFLQALYFSSVIGQFFSIFFTVLSIVDCHHLCPYLKGR